MFIGIRAPCDNVNFCGMIKKSSFGALLLDQQAHARKSDHCNEFTENHTAFGRTSLYLFATEKTRF